MADQTFTIGELYAVVLGILGFIAAVGAATSVISKAITKSKAPNVEQDKKISDLTERVVTLETSMRLHASIFSQTDARIKALEKNSRVTQEALLALLGHAIDGNNVEQLRNAQSRLHDLLFDTSDN